MIPLPLIDLVLVILFTFLFFFLITVFIYIFFDNRRREDEAIIWEEYVFLLSELKLTESLLLNVFPKSVANRLLRKPESFTEHYKDVTILFADIVGFTEFAEETSSKKLVELLDKLYSSFDELTDTLKVEKIKTIGDSYMGVAGIPGTAENHAEAVAETAIAMRKILIDFNKDHKQHLKLRVGINTGEVVAGVIGSKKFIYDMWGDSVNTASRMESHGLPNQIQVTEPTYELLKSLYIFEKRGKIKVKGKGKVQTYLLLDKRSES